MAFEQKRLIGTERTEFGKGASRRLRRDGQTPAVLYGHGQDPIHVAVDAHELFLIVKDNPNAIINIVKDEGASSDLLELVKDIQRNPVTRRITHVDLQRVTRNEKVEVEVPVEVTGEPAPGMIYTIELMNVIVKAPVIDIPDSVVADVEGLNAGERVTVADLKVADDVEIVADAEEVAVMVTEPQVDTALEEADAAMAEAQAEESAEAEKAEEEAAE